MLDAHMPPPPAARVGLPSKAIHSLHNNKPIDAGDQVGWLCWRMPVLQNTKPAVHLARAARPPHLRNSQDRP